MPCSRVTLGLLLALAGVWLARTLVGPEFSVFLDLSPPSLWRGQLWRPFTAPLLAAGPLELLFNGLALAWLASGLETRWRPREWLAYAVLGAAAAGLAAAALFPRAPSVPAGPGLLLLPLFVARARLARGERIHFSPTFSAPLPAALFALAGLSLLAAVSAGLPLPGLAALVLSAALGWLYLSLRWRHLAARPARPAPAARFHRLEL